ncbi:SCO-spondin-like [Styela clava]
MFDREWSIFVFLLCLKIIIASEEGSEQCSDKPKVCESYAMIDKDFCDDKNLEKFVRENCQKYCNKCTKENIPKVECKKNELRRYKDLGCCNAISGEQHCGRDSWSQSRGIPVNRPWPWQVIFLVDPNTFCAGALLTKNWIITAGECYKGYTNESGVTVFAGPRHFDNINPGTAQIRPGKRHILSDGTYSKSITNMLALTHINSVEIEKHRVPVFPICLPNGEKPETGMKCFFTGWGVGSESSILKEVDLTIMNQQNCITAFGDDFAFNQTNMLCGSTNQNISDACKVNTGGPLVCQRCDTCQWYLAGIHIYKSGCFENQYYAAFADIQYFEDWISESISTSLNKTGSCVKPFLGKFSEWSECSVSCGGGVRFRERKCINGRIGQEECPTDQSVELGKCNVNRSCAFFTDWSPWGECSQTCGKGEQKSARTCKHGEVGDNGCIGETERTQECVEAECAGWGEFNEWTKCSQTCGHGSRIRARKCINGKIGQDGCPPRQAVELESCFEPKCPTFTEWSLWGKCSRTCGEGEQISTRTCKHGKIGENGCIGERQKTQECLQAECGGWTEFNEWSECSKTCGAGSRVRKRECINGKLGDRDCPHPLAFKYQDCNIKKCPVFAEWSPWGECSQTCGAGVSKAIRTCNHGKIGDEGCIGETERTMECLETECASWGEYNEWSECSLTCGRGRRVRSRECTNGEIGDAGCPPDQENELGECNKQNCPTFTEWSPWGECSQLCGKGEQKAIRTCNHGQMGDDGCTGPTEKTRDCLIKDCESNMCLQEWMEDKKCLSIDRNRCSDNEVSQTCPNTCCTVLDFIPCIDDPKYLDYCNYYKSLCTDSSQSSIMLAYCKKTCGYCSFESDKK